MDDRRLHGSVTQGGGGRGEGGGGAQWVSHARGGLCGRESEGTLMMGWGEGGCKGHAGRAMPALICLICLYQEGERGQPAWFSQRKNAPQRHCQPNGVLPYDLFIFLLTEWLAFPLLDRIVLHFLIVLPRQGAVQLFPSVWQLPDHGAEAHDCHAHRGGEQQVRLVPPSPPNIQNLGEHSCG